ncbi:MAG: endo alpha-1,4 polygalactosaminidase [Eubacteriales bacterium]|nr:endo alpha-1,4 polygalactosaminidase [Eubacteriales bacterium]
MDYGVYLSSDFDTLPKNLNCNLLVIDAQNFTAEEIALLHEDNKNIYSYINIGAVENFRDYYETYLGLTLGPYENWPEERFVDVSEPSWRKFIVDDLAQELKEKGIDGFFVDNADVYYEYNTRAVFEGITEILEGLKETGMSVIVNGGDVYVAEYCSENGDPTNILDGVNQECVFTAINWENESFEESSDDTEQYYLDYLKNLESFGVKIYLLEYTTDEKLEDMIREKVDELGYSVYISDDLELD